MFLEPWTLVGQHATVRFSVVADASPGLLPRLLQPFAKRNLTPDALESRRVGETVMVEILLNSMPAEAVHVVGGTLGQVVGVRSVGHREEVTGRVQRRVA